MAFPKFQWCKGHGLPWSGKVHYGLRKNDDTVTHYDVKIINSKLLDTYYKTGIKH